MNSKAGEEGLRRKSSTSSKGSLSYCRVPWRKDMPQTVKHVNMFSLHFSFLVTEYWSQEKDSFYFVFAFCKIAVFPAIKLSRHSNASFDFFIALAIRLVRLWPSLNWKQILIIVLVFNSYVITMQNKIQKPNSTLSKGCGTFFTAEWSHKRGRSFFPFPASLPTAILQPAENKSFLSKNYQTDFRSSSCKVIN